MTRVAIGYPRQRLPLVVVDVVVAVVVTGCVVVNVVVGIPAAPAGADGEVDNVEDDAESSDNDEQYSDDSRLAMTVRVHNGSLEVS